MQTLRKQDQAELSWRDNVYNTKFSVETCLEYVYFNSIYYHYQCKLTHNTCLLNDFHSLRPSISPTTLFGVLFSVTGLMGLSMQSLRKQG